MVVRMTVYIASLPVADERYLGHHGGEVGFAVNVSGEASGSSKTFLAAKDIQIIRRKT